MVLEALSREIRLGCPWLKCPERLLSTNDLKLVSETLEGLEGRLEAWKGGLELKGLRVNVKKTKMMVSIENAGKIAKGDVFCYAVCRKVGCIRNF